MSPSVSSISGACVTINWGCLPNIGGFGKVDRLPFFPVTGHGIQ